MTLTMLPETAQPIAANDQWCAYCFGRLAATANQVEERAFVQCTHCRRYYHATCWQQRTQCVICGEHEALPCHDLLPLPPNLHTQPVQAVAAKPSAVFYYLAGTAYPVPPFVFEQVLPAYEYWRPRLQTTLALWHSNVKETCRSTLLMAMHYLLTQERFSPIGQWIQAHLALLTQILAILCYIVAFWLVRLLLRLIF